MKRSALTTGQRVFNALSYVEPKTTSQLCEETGLSYSTVREHLTALRAERITDTTPNRYLRPELVTPDTLKVWRSQRALIAERIRVLTISEGADPVWLADEFILLGRQLAEIGRQIDRVKMDPDWYQRLGGHFWLSDGEGKMQ